MNALQTNVAHARVYIPALIEAIDNYSSTIGDAELSQNSKEAADKLRMIWNDAKDGSDEKLEFALSVVHVSAEILRPLIDIDAIEHKAMLATASDEDKQNLRANADDARWVLVEVIKAAKLAAAKDGNPPASKRVIEDLESEFAKATGDDFKVIDLGTEVVQRFKSVATLTGNDKIGINSIGKRAMARRKHLNNGGCPGAVF